MLTRLKQYYWRWGRLRRLAKTDPARARWEAAKRRKTLRIPVGPHTTLAINPGYHIARELFEGRFEPEVSAFFRAYLTRGMTVVDAGANIGFFTLLAADRVGPEGAVHAFEPGTFESATLAANVRRNRLRNVRANAVGLWDAPDVLEFKEFGDGMGPFSSFGQSHKDDLAGLTPTVREVQVVRLDDYAAEAGLDRVDLMKLDVEGAEIHALRGAEQLLAGGRLKAVVLELCDDTTSGFGYPAKDIAEYLLSHGLTIHELADDGSLRAFPRREAYPYLNIVATGDPAALERLNA